MICPQCKRKCSFWDRFIHDGFCDYICEEIDKRMWNKYIDEKIRQSDIKFELDIKNRTNVIGADKR